MIEHRWDCPVAAGALDDRCGCLPVYIRCFECGHVYRTARELRTAYRRQIAEIVRARWADAPWRRPAGRLVLVDSRGELVWMWLASRFARAASIMFCQECTHDF